MDVRTDIETSFISLTRRSLPKKNVCVVLFLFDALLYKYSSMFTTIAACGAAT